MRGGSSDRAATVPVCWTGMAAHGVRTEARRAPGGNVRRVPEVTCGLSLGACRVGARFVVFAGASRPQARSFGCPLAPRASSAPGGSAMPVLPDLPQTEIAILEMTNAFRKEHNRTLLK